jgi:hypothetical protein
MANDRHARAARALQEAIARGGHGAVITTSFVLDETATHIRMEWDAETAAKFVRAILESESVTIVWIDAAKFRESLDLFQRSADKHWSFTDCASFVVMRDLGIERAFSFDHNFEEAGFVRLP